MVGSDTVTVFHKIRFMYQIKFWIPISTPKQPKFETGTGKERERKKRDLRQNCNKFVVPTTV